MAIPIKGPWGLPEIEDFLTESALPMRLACIGDDGFPRVVSVWYRYEAPTLLGVTHRDASLVTLLRRNSRVGFEIAPDRPPYRGVRGQGRVQMRALGQDATLQQLLGRYLGGEQSRLAQWLLKRSEDEILLTVKPTRLFSWDYRERMADIA